jgi:hypothetical protein
MRRVLRVLTVVALALATTGCGVIIDLAWLATGPDASHSDTGAERAIEGTDTRWREVSFDPQLGLMCADRAQPRTRTSGAFTEVHSPDGYLGLMQAALVFDAVLLTTIIAGAGAHVPIDRRMDRRRANERPHQIDRERREPRIELLARPAVLVGARALTNGDDRRQQHGVEHERCLHEPEVSVG